ncbi:MAG TPA: family 20 glycosylhydrolase [Flavobacteriaceae bacterium]|nr:family 20 glycosylhydrolase [Flavobacteriaceae bacterium]
MPWPKSVKELHSKFVIDSTLTITINGHNNGRIHTVATKFLRRLADRTGVFLDQGFPTSHQTGSIEINFKTVSDLSLQHDESYILDVGNQQILITAVTDVGAMRALETLLQLANFDASGYYFEGVHIEDSPRFVWRGLMIDAARHFQPVSVLKRNLDAMASVKLNVFHWHLTDDQGFRIESKVYPRLQELGSDGLFYTQEQIKDVVRYASNLGIRVVPEIDVPGHASAILTAYPEIGSKAGYPYHIERYAGIFDPTLDPTNPKTYEFLDHLLAEIAPLFPDEYFHIGGDENAGKHWDENKNIQQFKQENNLKTNHDLQTYFNIKLEKILKKYGKKLMGWDEIMTPNMPTTAIIHSWRGENEGLSKRGTLITAAKLGYQTVLSNGYYIDRMLSVKHHYSVDPIGDAQLTKEERSRILGGEATMWSELVTPMTIDSRIWPRMAAIAERFWSPKNVKNIDNMLKRLKVVSYNLEELGITHIKNRDVILRIMSNHHNNDALKELSELCEPLKMYTRNAGGTEYKSFSPFTLFADACVADAKDALAFNKLVNKFNDNPDEEIINGLKSYFKEWSNNYEELSPIAEVPNIKPLILLSQHLSKTSKLLFSTFENKMISTTDLRALKASLNILKQPFADTELAIVNSLYKLEGYCEKNYLVP